MLAHDARVCCLHLTVRIARNLSSIQRGFLLDITVAYRITPTAALQVILGIPPLHLQLQAGCQNNRIVQTPKQNSRHSTPYPRRSLSTGDWLDYTSLQASSSSPNIT
ncbi:hypothetical protein AVEN_203679-1 [Araneus ventricosus]|uniref:Uncharacterized protein n=1 Tax=Araneus ventricosus TaxID=182803 RepID=A0A4Y2F0M2_ARAVE|nr:hypothetical protein AVEN_203679-1 [Araneus ventricosus]